jgi:hypothetical protein
MIDLILSTSPERPITLFTRNFRVHSGIPLGLYSGGERSPVALVYGEAGPDMFAEMAQLYQAVVVIPSARTEAIPDMPSHYETMTVKAPILAEVRTFSFPGFECLINTFEGAPLVLLGSAGKTPILLFTADLVKATVRILSGEMELKSGLDCYGRHLPLPEHITGAPAVSFHFNLIEQAIRYLYRKINLPLLSVPRWPSSAPLAIFLSHDVDVVKKWTRKRIAYELLVSLKGMFSKDGKRLDTTIASIRDAMQGRDPYWNFDELLFMESGNGFKSTWFLAPFGKEYSRRENEYDPVYRRKSSEITAMIRRIADNDCEVAFHGTRGAFHDLGEFKRQLASFETRLGYRLYGVRHHYLMFRHGQSFETATEAGMLYDATLGFSDRVGFRNGIAAPFFPCASTHAAGKIVAIPLHFMDTVFTHMNEPPETVIRRITETYIFSKAAGGLFSMLVHPGNMDPSEMPPLARFYQSFLNRCRLDRAHSMTGLELAQWWTARERVIKALESAPGMWRITGAALPQNMDISISAPNIKAMKFVVEGARESVARVDRDILTIRPGVIDPEKGVTFVQKF